VAVLVADPEPAVVFYDTSGNEVGRTPVDVPAPSIVDADRLTDAGGTSPTPAVRDGSTRFSVVGDTLVVVSEQSASVQTTPTPSLAQLETEPPTPGVLASEGPAEPVTEQIQDLVVGWTRQGVLGLPAVIGDQVLLPIPAGLAAVAAGNGNPGIVPVVIPVDRAGYTGRVDAAAVGTMIIETRGDRVVGLG